MIKDKILYYTVLALGLSAFQNSEALCINGKLTIEKEYTDSKFVGIVTLTKQTLIEDSSDRMGYSSIRYDFDVKRTYKGGGREISVWIENTSSRFVFEKGREYLIFSQQFEGHGYVDACGNSGLVNEVPYAIKWLNSHQK